MGSLPAERFAQEVTMCPWLPLGEKGKCGRGALSEDPRTAPPAPGQLVRTLALDCLLLRV